ncbi:MAG: hypothetical protein H6Q61_1032 [Firmicutes bacterium]|nr:hypothetical protein [Bacillota bacterium]
MIPLFDGHCDTIFECCAQGKHLLRENRRFREELGEAQGEICHCRTAQEAVSAFATGRAAAFLSVEGADLLGCNLEGLRRAYDLGVRAVNLTWNRANVLSGSCVEESERGLSSLGRQFVAEMQELGMLVDVSHLSDPGFCDVMELCKRPVFASHSNARAVLAHPRNLTDEMFLALGRNGGVAGLNCYAGFLGDDPDFDVIRRHLERFLALDGEDHVALGGDWDGCDVLPRGMENGIAGLLDFYEYLLQKNFSETLLHKLYFQNLMRVVGEVCTT